MLAHCVLTNNTAAFHGGGAYQGRLERSIISGNQAAQGAGAWSAYLVTSVICSNTASMSGGGVDSSALLHCTVVGNSAPYDFGGGVFYSSARNSIIYYNTSPNNAPWANDWDPTSQYSLASCWTTSWTGINGFGPQLVADGIHLAAVSPCRGGANPLYTTGTDIDGEPWLNPPSIGCDEYYAADFRGPLNVGPIMVTAMDGPTPLRNVNALVTTGLSGNADRMTWAFGDGTTVTNGFGLVVYHRWMTLGDFTVRFTAYNGDNPAGVMTNTVVHVVAPEPPLISGFAFGGTNFAVQFAARYGISYALERSTNLAPPVQWQSVTSVYGFGSNSIAVDPAPSGPESYYRLHSP